MFETYLKQIRYATFATQEEFCRKAEIPLGTYKNWELGRQLPSPRSWANLYTFICASGAKKEMVEKLERAYLNEKV